MTPPTGISSAAALSFSDIIAPLSRDDFVARYWEKRHLFLHRHDPTYYGAMFSLADVDRWIVAAQSNPADLLLIVTPRQSGHLVERKRLRDVTMTQLYGAFQSGSTLVLEGIEKSWPPVAQLATTVGEAFSARVTVNMYMTPANTQGVPVHPDVEDVLILQMDGRKEWFIYEKTSEICRDTLTYLRELRKPVPGRMEEPPLLERATLDKGDLLYIPRGLPHKAVATVGGPSLHLTVCIDPLCWVDFLKAAVEVASIDQPQLAGSLPPGFAADQHDRREMAATFASMLSLFRDQVSYEQTLATLIRARVTASHYPADGHFAQLAGLAELSVNQWVERRPGMSCLVEASEGSALISFAACQVSGPPALAPLLEFVRDHQRFRIAQLPGGLGDETKLVLVRRLIREGLLRAHLGDNGGPRGHHLP
jgi:lysine-specific demethylase/histidyl-hydroxylase NO66